MVMIRLRKRWRDDKRKRQLHREKETVPTRARISYSFQVNWVHCHFHSLSSVTNKFVFIYFCFKPLWWHLATKNNKVKKTSKTVNQAEPAFNCAFRLFWFVLFDGQQSAIYWYLRFVFLSALLLLLASIILFLEKYEQTYYKSVETSDIFSRYLRTFRTINFLVFKCCYD